MTPLYLVDNSVIQRLSNPMVRQAWNVLVDAGEVATCLPTALEAGYSARNAREHAMIVAFERSAKVVLSPTRQIADIALALQSALFEAGHGRAVGVSDLQIAATALHYAQEQERAVIVVHYDSGFDHLSRVWPAFTAHWIVPRGSVA